MVGEGLVVLSVEGAGGGKHDGGVQVSDDARHRAASRDAGLRALVTGLERREDKRHLEGKRERRIINAKTLMKMESCFPDPTHIPQYLLGDGPRALDQLPLGVAVRGHALQRPGLLDQEDAAVPQVLHPGLDLEPDLIRGRVGHGVMVNMGQQGGGLGISRVLPANFLVLICLI